MFAVVPERRIWYFPVQSSNTQSGHLLCFYFNLNWAQCEGKEARGLPSTPVSSEYCKQGRSHQTSLSCVSAACEHEDLWHVSQLLPQVQGSHLRCQMVSPQSFSECTSIFTVCGQSGNQFSMKSQWCSQTAQIQTWQNVWHVVASLLFTERPHLHALCPLSKHRFNAHIFIVEIYLFGVMPREVLELPSPRVL